MVPSSIVPEGSGSRRIVRVVAALSVLTVSLGFGVSAASSSTAAERCGPAPSGQVAVVVVVDTGSASPSSRCALVAQGATGLDALRASGHVVRLDGGFVCGIDGLPATGCGNRPDAGLAYWRYWHADPGGAWKYSQVGAGGYRLPSRCAVEGWIWSASAPSDTPPRTTPVPPLCEAPSAPPATSAPVGSGPASPAPIDPAGEGGPIGATPGAVQGMAGAAPGGVATTVPTAVAGASTLAHGATDPNGDQPSSLGDRPDAAGTGGREEPVSARSPAPGGGEGASSGPWGALGGVALVVGLAGAALVRSRSRAIRSGLESGST